MFADLSPHIKQTGQPLSSAAKANESTHSITRSIFFINVYFSLIYPQLAYRRSKSSNCMPAVVDILNPKLSFLMLINLHCCVGNKIAVRRKPEYLERTHVDLVRSYKPRTENPENWLFCCVVKALTAPPSCQRYV